MKIVVAPLVLSFGMMLFGCKKEECHHCHYDANGSEIDLGEKCGDEVARLEANGYTVNGTNYTVHCGEH